MMNIDIKKKLVIGVALCFALLIANSHAAYYDPNAVRKNSAGQLDNWLHYYRGLEQIQAKWWEQAELEFKYYFNNAGLHRHMFGIAYFGMGLMYQAKGAPDLAIDNFKMAIKEDTHPDVKITDKAWLNIGTIHMKKKAYKDAVDAYTKAIESDPKNGQAHYNLGLACVKTGNLDQAEKSLAEAKKLGIALIGLDEQIQEARKNPARSSQEKGDQPKKDRKARSKQKQ